MVLGEPLAEERWDMGLFRWQEAGGWVDEWVRAGEGATLTSQDPEEEGFQVPSYGTHFCPAVSSPTLEGISKIMTHV